MNGKPPTSLSVEERLFAVIVHSKQMLAFDKSIMTKEGERFWALVEPEGWVEASSCRATPGDPVPGDVLTFPTRTEAERFARHWKGHPWWCSPNGEFEIVEMIPRKVIETRVIGYEVYRG